MDNKPLPVLLEAARFKFPYKATADIIKQGDSEKIKEVIAQFSMCYHHLESVLSLYSESLRENIILKAENELLKQETSCKKECKADAARKGCISCGRTMEEITLAGRKARDEKQ